MAYNTTDMLSRILHTCPYEKSMQEAVPKPMAYECMNMIERSSLSSGLSESRPRSTLASHAAKETPKHWAAVRLSEIGSQ